MTASDAETLAQAVSAFGAAAKATLSNPAIVGDPEDQLRAPLVVLVKALAPLSGLGGYDTELVGETRLPDLTVRPDFAVTRKGVLVGFIEVKAPGKGADPTRFRATHDKEQWEKLKALPNLIYTDGNAFSLWQDARSLAPEGDRRELLQHALAGHRRERRPVGLGRVQRRLELGLPQEPPGGVAGRRGGVAGVDRRLPAVAEGEIGLQEPGFLRG